MTDLIARLEAADTITSLIEKLEQAEVGSRELDVAIWAHLNPERIKVVEFWPAYTNLQLTAVSFTLPPKRTEHVTHDKGDYLHARPVTTSLDAALALAERTIKARGPIDMSIMGSAQVVILAADPCANALSEAFGNTPALALCAAILKAKEPTQ